MKLNLRLIVAVFTIAVLSVSAAQAGSPKAACEKAKLKAAAKRQLCLAKEAGEALVGHVSDPKKCKRKFAAALAEADARAHAKGSYCRFIDNGDGTVSDPHTGLMWQKTDDKGGVTDKDNRYAWSSRSNRDETEPDETVFTEFLAKLNAGTLKAPGRRTKGCFAEHCDWRLPVMEELLTIWFQPNYPTDNVRIFGPNTSSEYWSSSTHDDYTGYAWNLFGDPGRPWDFTNKTQKLAARAVRGGW